MLRNKLFMGFALVILIFAVLSVFLGVNAIQSHVIQEAQNRVRLDLSSARAVYDNRLDKISTIMRLLEDRQIVEDSCASARWDDPRLADCLAGVRRDFGLDFMGILSPEGEVVLRVMPPFEKGDFKNSELVLARALAGSESSGVAVWSQPELKNESMELAERAFLELEETPHARMTSRVSESRGMVMLAAVPVRVADRLSAVLYGGVLLNRDEELIDEIADVVYRNESYADAPLGTATIFLHDCRIATTVRRADGNRALGTRVSKEVADQVLDNGRPWIGEAFVVRDWYLTAYEPIRDIEHKIVGMLYVGILKRPFLDYGKRLIVRYSYLSLGVLVLSLVVAFLLAGSLARPIHRLVEAAQRMSAGDRPPPVSARHACRETGKLVRAFNVMTATLAEREESLKATNRSYMETLGFVAHELKSPIAGVVNYLYLLRQHKLGALTERQDKVIRICERNVQRVVEMIRHYLNLSRIENRELQPVRSRVQVLDEVVEPLLEAAEEELRARGQLVENRIAPGVVLRADPNMIREVFDNLIGNAVKYGKQGGVITLEGRPAGGFVEFAVRNEGEGIAAEALSRLFQKFSRLGHEKQKGTGLGLFITRHIVEAHGGTITASSRPGEWVQFTFTLPADGEPEGRHA